MKWRFGGAELAIAELRATLKEHPNDTEAAKALFGCDEVRCKYCGVGFLVGHKTGHRITAQYCSDLHRAYAARDRQRSADDGEEWAIVDGPAW